MSALRLSRGVDLKGPLILLMAILLALVLGLLTSILPWFIVVGLVVAPIVVLGSTVNPRIGLVVVLMLIFEVIPKSGASLPIGGGQLQLYDALLIMLSGILLVRALVNRQHPLKDLGPARWPLYYLLLCMMASYFYVKGFAPNKTFLSEGRAAIMWLVLPAIALSVDSPKRFKNFLAAVMFIGLVIALYVTIQSLFDVRIMNGARVESLDGSMNRDVTRSIAGGGIYIVVFCLLLVLNRAYEGRLRWYFALPMALLLVAGIGVQFGRGVWAATAVGLVISASLFRGIRGLAVVLVASIITVACALAVAYAVKPRVAEALVERAVGVRAEVESGGSFDWRLQENRAAMTSISHHPWTGVGVGGEYKQTVSAAGSFGIETMYIHNGYLYFPVKMGLFAAFIPLTFIVAFVVTLRQGTKAQTTHRDSALVAALAGALAVPALTSFTQPEWTAPQGITAFSILIGLAILYRRFGAPRVDALTTVSRSSAQ